jgi:capsular polysaccharide biosynthesis protein
VSHAPAVVQASAARVTVFILDSSYPTADVAIPLDDDKNYVIVSDRPIEPPRGVATLQLERVVSVAPMVRNYVILRRAWRSAQGRACIVVAAPVVRAEQLLRNSIYALLLTSNVVFFDGLRCRSIARSWNILFRGFTLGVAKLLLRDGLMQGRKMVAEVRARVGRMRSTEEGALFGLYTSKDSFRFQPDPVTVLPDGSPVYGELSSAWYLPAFSARKLRYSVSTSRQVLRDVSLHVEKLNGFEVSSLFRAQKILAYPYMLGSARRWYSYPVASRRRVSKMPRGVNLLAYSSTYYHWLIEGVPRILDVIDDGIDLDKYPLILPPLEPFQKQLLEVLGIDAVRQVFSVDIGDWCHVGECIFPTANFPFGATNLEDPSGQPERKILLRIRNRLKEKLAERGVFEQPLGPSRVYISRAKAGRRKFSEATEADLHECLSAVGFQRIFLEDYAWPEQVRLLSNARHIVGLHGAGLTNILFADAETLIEIHNPMQVRPYFAVMARELSVRYSGVIGGLENSSLNFDNITANVPQIAKLVRHMLPP